MKKLSIILPLIVFLTLGGCAGMSDTQQRTLSGAAIGTAAHRNDADQREAAAYISGENIAVDGGVIRSVLAQLPRE